MITRVTIRGMRSVHCVRAVFTALGGVDGVVRAEVAMGEAVIDHDERATAEAVGAALNEVGYQVSEWRAEKRLPVL